MQREVFLRSSGIFGKFRGQQRGRICDQNGLFRHRRRELLIKRNPIVWIFRHRFNHQIGVLDRFVNIQFQPNRISRLSHARRACFRIKRIAVSNAARPNPAALSFWRRHLLNRFQIRFLQLRELRLRSSDAALASQPDRYVKSAVRRLKRNLAFQHAAACNHDILEFLHMHRSFRFGMLIFPSVGLIYNIIQ